jgi:hypothetical protein
MNRDVAVTPEQRETLRAIRQDPGIRQQIAETIKHMYVRFGVWTESVIDMRQARSVGDNTYQNTIQIYPLLPKDEHRRRRIVNALNRVKIDNS